MAAAISILLGSASDLPKFQGAFARLEELEVPYEVSLASAHRDPERVMQLVHDAEAQGTRVFVAGAGMAAHLGGMIAAHTTRPVVGVPLSGSAVQGMDALLSTVQMPKGMPVATVGIDQAENGVLLATQILAVHDEALHGRLQALRRSARDALREQDRKLQAAGPEGFSRS